MVQNPHYNLASCSAMPYWINHNWLSSHRLSYCSWFRDSSGWVYKIYTKWNKLYWKSNVLYENNVSIVQVPDLCFEHMAFQLLVWSPAIKENLPLHDATYFTGWWVPTIRNFFLISNLNIFPCNFSLLVLVLPSRVTENESFFFALGMSLMSSNSEKNKL